MKKVVASLLIVLFALNVVNAQKRPDPQPAPDTKEAFKVGIAGYTFAKFDIDKTLETMQREDVHYLCIKDFHLPLNSTAEQIAAFKKKLSDKGVTGYAVGPIYMKNKEEVDRAFEYAKNVGVKLIVGVPEYDLLPYVDKKVKEYDFRIAIHLHGPDINKYRDAKDVWDHVKDLDSRIGMCFDMGHDTRNGNDAVQDLKKYHDRIFDVHLKDVTGNTGAGYSVEVGRGIIDFTAMVKMLRKVKYTGMVSLEHERNMDNPFMGIAESIGYFRGVIAATRK
ncbi:sugar phosphate isomerase/epimerase family protein [Maribellus sp. YY47]|uniref:sugar phosphate isomerase/epimerase family protein n=1 Tax=Maribellus sp. YY47 TaxID=2929486 RepID=UPI0020019ABA|nr:sugar phosphate isomerase/epimerase family protein [Maribellus sp. YY47]MCK3683621.1 sugar phosphate isomerase/epimerase [Maribellus sp. YY47]